MATGASLGRGRMPARGRQNGRASQLKDDKTDHYPQDDEAHFGRMFEVRSPIKMRRYKVDGIERH